MDEDTLLYIQSVEKRFEALREADLTAVHLEHQELSHRLEGFPQLFTTKAELELARESLVRLEKEAIPREVYEQRHDVLVDRIVELERTYVSQSLLDIFRGQYEIDQERNIADRRNVVDALAGATDKVRQQLLEDRSDYVAQDAYEERHAALQTRVGAIERWEYKLVGGLVFATFIAPIISAIIVYYVTHPHV